MNNYTDWYVRHLGGTGKRIKVKPTSTSVHVGAGSTSQMVQAKSYSYQEATIDGIKVIRFTKAWAAYHEYLLQIAFTLDEYKEWKIKKANGPDQQELEEFF